MRKHGVKARTEIGFASGVSVSGFVDAEFQGLLVRVRCKSQIPCRSNQGHTTFNKIPPLVEKARYLGLLGTLSHSESVVRLSWPSIASALILMRKLSLSKRPGVQIQVAAYMSIGLIVGYRCVCELWGYYAAPRLYGIYGFRAEKLQGQGQRFRQILRVTLAAWFVVQQDG